MDTLHNKGGGQNKAWQFLNLDEAAKASIRDISTHPLKAIRNIDTAVSPACGGAGSIGPTAPSSDITNKHGQTVKTISIESPRTAHSALRSPTCNSSDAPCGRSPESSRNPPGSDTTAGSQDAADSHPDQPAITSACVLTQGAPTALEVQEAAAATSPDNSELKIEGIEEGIQLFDLPGLYNITLATAVGYADLIRQVEVHCGERGRVLAHIWNCHLNTLDSTMMALRQTNVSLQSKIGEVDQEKQSMMKEIKSMDFLRRETLRFRRELEVVGTERDALVQQCKTLQDDLAVAQSTLKEVEAFTNSRLSGLRWRHSLAVLGTRSQQCVLQTGGLGGYNSLRDKVQMLEKLSASLIHTQRRKERFGRAQQPESYTVGIPVDMGDMVQATMLGPQVLRYGGKLSNESLPVVSVDMLMNLMPEARTMVLATLPESQRWKLLEAMRDQERAEVVIAMNVSLRSDAREALGDGLWDRTMEVIRSHSTHGARFLYGLDFDSATAEFLTWGTYQQLDVLAALDAVTAAGILTRCPQELRRDLLQMMEPHLAANIMQAMLPPPAAKAIDDLEVRRAMEILMAMDPERAAAILAELGAEKAAQKLMQLDSNTRTSIIGSMAPRVSAATLRRMDEVQGDQEEEGPEFMPASAQTVGGLEPEAAHDIMGYMNMADQAEVLAHLPASKIAQLLSLMDPYEAVMVLASLKQHAKKAVADILPTSERQNLIKVLKETDADVGKKKSKKKADLDDPTPSINQEMVKKLAESYEELSAQTALETAQTAEVEAQRGSTDNKNRNPKKKLASVGIQVGIGLGTRTRSQSLPVQGPASGQTEGNSIVLPPTSSTPDMAEELKAPGIAADQEMTRVLQTTPGPSEHLVSAQPSCADFQEPMQEQSMTTVSSKSVATGGNKTTGNKKATTKSSANKKVAAPSTAKTSKNAAKVSEGTTQAKAASKAPASAVTMLASEASVPDLEPSTTPPIASQVSSVSLGGAETSLQSVMEGDPVVEGSSHETFAKKDSTEDDAATRTPRRSSTSFADVLMTAAGTIGEDKVPATMTPRKKKNAQPSIKGSQGKTLKRDVSKKMVEILVKESSTVDSGLTLEDPLSMPLDSQSEPQSKLGRLPKNARLVEAMAQHKNAKPKPKGWLMAAVESMYKEGDSLLRKFGRVEVIKRQSVPEIVFAYFHNKYGQRALVDEYVGSLVNTLTLYKKTDLRLEAFARFLSEEWDMSIFLDFLSAQAMCLQPMKVVCIEYVREANKDEQYPWVDLNKAVYISDMILGLRSSAARESFVTHLQTYAEPADDQDVEKLRKERREAQVKDPSRAYEDMPEFFYKLPRIRFLLVLCKEILYFNKYLVKIAEGKFDQIDFQHSGRIPISAVQSFLMGMLPRNASEAVMAEVSNAFVSNAEAHTRQTSTDQINASSVSVLSREGFVVACSQTPAVREHIKMNLIQPASYSGQDEESVMFHTLLSSTITRHSRCLMALWQHHIKDDDRGKVLMGNLQVVLSDAAGDVRFKAYIDLLTGIINTTVRDFLDGILEESQEEDLNDAVLLEDKVCRLEDAVLLVAHGMNYLLEENRWLSVARMKRIPPGQSIHILGGTLLAYRKMRENVVNNAAYILQSAWRTRKRRMSVAGSEGDAVDQSPPQHDSLEEVEE